MKADEPPGGFDLWAEGLFRLSDDPDDPPGSLGLRRNRTVDEWLAGLRARKRLSDLYRTLVMLHPESESLFRESLSVAGYVGAEGTRRELRAGNEDYASRGRLSIVSRRAGASVRNRHRADELAAFDDEVRQAAEGYRASYGVGTIERGRVRFADELLAYGGPGALKRGPDRTHGRVEASLRRLLLPWLIGRPGAPKKNGPAR